MKLKICLAALLLTIVSFNKAFAVATTVDFLKLSVGARETAMGESAAAVCGDVTAMYWNPAGLAKIERKEVNFSHSDALMDATLEFLGGAYSFGKYGTLAAGGIFYLIKPVPVTGMSGEVLGDLNWRDQAIILSYGYKISESLAVGAGVKYVQRLEDDPIFGSAQGSTYGLDAGLTYKTPLKGLDIGCALLNSGPELQMTGEKKKDALPQTTRAGLAYGFDTANNMSVTFAGDMFRVLGGEWSFGGGCEIFIHKMLGIRVGYYKKEGNIVGNTYGVGLKTGSIRIDVSNVPASEIVGYTRSNKVSFSLLFD